MNSTSVRKRDDDIENVLDEVVGQTMQMPIPGRNRQISVTHRDLNNPGGGLGLTIVGMAFTFNLLVNCIILLRLFGVV